jgi:hypothetical protein
MIWLTWRRHRPALFVMGGALIAIAVWMVVVGHSFEVASRTRGPNGCFGNLVFCNGVSHGWFSFQNQAGYLDVFLFMVPCVLGIVLGAPLVAGELQSHTNRLAWTQSISRSRWLVIKWSVVGLSAIALAALLQVVAQWWSGHVLVNFLETSSVPGTDRIAPRLFGITGIVPIAYTLFAFALAVALGAIFRRTLWAVVGTIIGYAASAVLLVFNIRPYRLFSPVFVPQLTGPNGTSVAFMPQTVLSRPAWSLGFGFRLFPGVVSPYSANEIAQRCQDRNYNYAPYLRCLASHHVQMGSFYQGANRYWPLQWSEAGIYLAATLVLFGLTLWAVRRWRA